jgi:hypothetical protein
MSLPHGPQAEVSSEPAVYNWTRSVLDCAEAGLPDFLQRQRWYPAKDAGNPSVTLTALLPFPASAVLAAIAVWQVTPPDRSPMNLFIPVALVRGRDADPAQVIAPHLPDTGDVDEEMQLVEAFSVDEFAREWVDRLLRQDGGASGQIRLRVEKTERLVKSGLPPGGHWAIHRGSAEQSNTSIKVGDKVVSGKFSKSR